VYKILIVKEWIFKLWVMTHGVEPNFDCGNQDIICEIYGGNKWYFLVDCIVSSVSFLFTAVFDSCM
jgi:hypothetical protein